MTGNLIYANFMSWRPFKFKFLEPIVLTTRISGVGGGTLMKDLKIKADTGAGYLAISPCKDYLLV